MTVNATPLVRATADRLGVDINAVLGTGAGGRVTVDDVRAVAAAERGSACTTDEAVYGQLFGGRALAAAPLPRPGRAMDTRSAFNATVVVQIDPYGRNPLVEDLRQAVPLVHAAAMREGSAPTLFSSGDLPPFTASGIDVNLLLRLPWQARHPAARADSAQALQILESYAAGVDPAAPAAMAALDFGQDQGNLDYDQRVHRWASGLAAR